MIRIKDIKFESVMVFSIKNFDDFLDCNKGKIIGAMFSHDEIKKLTNGIHLIASNDFKMVMKEIRKNRFNLDNWFIQMYNKELDESATIAIKY